MTTSTERLGALRATMLQQLVDGGGLDPVLSWGLRRDAGGRRPRAAIGRYEAYRRPFPIGNVPVLAAPAGVWEVE